MFLNKHSEDHKATLGASSSVLLLCDEAQLLLRCTELLQELLGCLLSCYL